MSSPYGPGGGPPGLPQGLPPQVVQGLVNQIAPPPGQAPAPPPPGPGGPPPPGGPPGGGPPDQGDDKGPTKADEPGLDDDQAEAVKKLLADPKSRDKKLEPEDPMWASVNLNGVLADLNSAYNRFAAAVPMYVCPMCKGTKPDGCKCCKGKGVISKFVWSQLPDEMKPKNGRPF